MDAVISSGWGTVSVWRGAHGTEVAGNLRVKSGTKIRIVSCGVPDASGVAEVIQVCKDKGGIYKVNHFKRLKEKHK